MRVFRSGSRYVAAGNTYEHRDSLKAAGWRWDPAARVWWTDDAMRVERLVRSVPGVDLAPEAKEAIDAHHQAVEESKAAHAEDVHVPAPAGLAYLPYQLAGIRYAASRPSALIADEPGLGKTIQAIGLVNLDDGLRRVLIVCPAVVKRNWALELQKWLVRPLSVGIADARTWPDTDVVIVNYDVLDRHAERLGEPWDLVVWDEAHYCKNPKARRTQLALSVCARRRLALTGTPILNRPIEAWPILCALDPARWNERTFWQFARRYCGARQVWAGRRVGYVWDFSGASNLSELQEVLRSTVMVRRRKADVLTDLPPKVRQVVELPANGLADLVREEAETWERHAAKIAALRVAVVDAQDTDGWQAAVEALRRATREAFESLSVARHRVAMAKVPLVVEWVRDLLDGGVAKVVVWAHHRDVISELVQQLGAVSITGDTPEARRQETVRRFQEDPSVRVFVGSITAAGVGITLTAASHVVFAELDWVPANITQAEDRCHRIGQHDSVLVQHLVLEGSLDAHMARVVVDKQQVLDQALDADAADVAFLPSARESFRGDPAAVLECLRILAGLDADRAMLRNGQGPDRFDSPLVHELTRREQLTPRQAALGAALVRKYRRQLPAELVARVLENPRSS